MRALLTERTVPRAPRFVRTPFAWNPVGVYRTFAPARPGSLRQGLALEPHAGEQGFVLILGYAGFVAVQQAHEHFHGERADLARVIIDPGAAEFGVILELDQADVAGNLLAEGAQPSDHRGRMVDEQCIRALPPEPGGKFGLIGRDRGAGCQPVGRGIEQLLPQIGTQPPVTHARAVVGLGKYEADPPVAPARDIAAGWPARHGCRNGFPPHGATAATAGSAPAPRRRSVPTPA